MNTIDIAKKSFSFNKIIIIESLRNHPDEIVRKSVAPSLKQAIENNLLCTNERITDLSNLKVSHIQINNHQEWNSFWINIADECSSGIIPIFHFVCHGTQEGLLIADGNNYTLEKWEILLKRLAVINCICKNNLFVSMCVCNGFFNLLHLLNPSYRLPFYGILSSPDLVDAEEVNITLVDFYCALLSNLNVNTAYQKIINDIERIKATTSKDDISRWFLLFSDDLLLNAILGDFEKRSTPKKLHDTAVKALKENNLPTSNEKIIRLFMGINWQKLEEEYKNTIKYKLFLDVYPDSSIRYDLPKNIKEIRERSQIKFNDQCH